MAYKLTAANVSRVLRQARFSRSDVVGFSAWQDGRDVRVRHNDSAYGWNKRDGHEELQAYATTLREHGWPVRIDGGTLRVLSDTRVLE